MWDGLMTSGLINSSFSSPSKREKRESNGNTYEELEKRKEREEEHLAVMEVGSLDLPCGGPNLQ